MKKFFTKNISIKSQKINLGVNTMAMWNPWRGCKKCSDGCLHCYIHKGDSKRNVNTYEIVKTKDFYKPVEKLKNGNYKMKAGLVYVSNSHLTPHR